VPVDPIIDALLVSDIGTCSAAGRAVRRYDELRGHVKIPTVGRLASPPAEV